MLLLVERYDLAVLKTIIIIIIDRNEQFSARDVIYTSRAYATMSVSVCLSSVCVGSALAHYS